MANTRVLVKRRKAIRNIKKITRTMELIATSRFKKAMDRATQAEAYTRKIAEMAGDLTSTAGTVHHPLLERRETIGTSLLLVICSNRGLCGGYNAGILREASLASREMKANNISIWWELAGKRAINYFRYQGIKADKTYTQFEDRPAFDEVEEIADTYLNAFVSGKIDRVQVAYMKFFSAGVQRPVVETLLPLETIAPEVKEGKGTAEVKEARKGVEYEFLPDAASLLRELLPVSFKVRLFKCFLDAAVSEQIARRVTMKQATENADDMIKSISREYNRARQANITKEILEVIGGAEALK